MRLPLNGGQVWVDYVGYEGRSGRVGHIDNWLPDEPPEVEINAALYEGKGRALIDGKWVETTVEIDVMNILNEDDLEELETRIMNMEEEDYYE